MTKIWNREALFSNQKLVIPYNKRTECIAIVFPISSILDPLYIDSQLFILSYSKFNANIVYIVVHTLKFFSAIMDWNLVVLFGRNF